MWPDDRHTFKCSFYFFWVASCTYGATQMDSHSLERRRWSNRKQSPDSVELHSLPGELRTVGADLSTDLSAVARYTNEAGTDLNTFYFDLASLGLNKEASWKPPVNRGYLRVMDASWPAAGVKRCRGSNRRPPARWCWWRRSSWRTEERWVDDPPFYSRFITR